MRGDFLKSGEDMPERPTWAMIAALFLAPRVYE